MGYTYRYTDQWEGFMKYAVETGSGAMIYSYIPSFIKIGSGIQNLRGYTDTQTAWRSHKYNLVKVGCGQLYVDLYIPSYAFMA
jgi:hypothetical protein